MTNENSDKQPQPSAHEPELLPAMMAIALAVVAQLAIQDGLTLLGLAGYVVAAWLFVASVRHILDVPSVKARPLAAAHDVPAGVTVTPGQTLSGRDRLRFLRRHWRQVTIAEIVSGDVPPARLADLLAEKAVEDLLEAGSPAAGAAEETATAQRSGEQTQANAAPAAAHMVSWTASKSPASAPKAVKVTPQGEVLVLDTGAEQVLRFDEKGALLATYSVSGLAGVHAIDLDVSPDGRTLYIVDAASARLQVVNLVDTFPSGGAGEMDEEE